MTIVRELNKSKTLGYLELYRKVSSSYKRISRAAYDFHMKKLINEKTLQNRDTGRGKPVYYFLSAEAKQKLRLQILQHKSKKDQTTSINESEEKRQLLYILLFVFQKRSHEFEEDDPSPTFFKPGKRKRVERSSLQKASPDDNYPGYEEHAYISTVGSFHRYSYENSGISVSEFSEKIQDHVFEHVGFTHEEIQNAIDNLIKEGLLKQERIYGEVRYEVVDNKLLDSIFEFIGLFNMVLRKMKLVWTYIRKPTEQDRKWLQVLYGYKNTEEYLRHIRYDRHSLTKRKNKKKIRQEIEFREQGLEQAIKDLLQTYKEIINKYRFLCEKMLQVVYPVYLQKFLIKSGI